MNLLSPESGIERKDVAEDCDAKKTPVDMAHKGYIASMPRLQVHVRLQHLVSHPHYAKGSTSHRLPSYPFSLALEQCMHNDAGHAYVHANVRTGCD